MDLKNKRIIIELDKNARQSYSQIAKNVKLSKQVVNSRIHKLEKSIIDGYYPIINFHLLGYSLYLVYLKVINMPKDKEKEFINNVTNTKGVGVNTTVFGDWNFNLALWSKNTIEFEKSLNNVVKDFEQYITKKTIMIESEAYYFKFKLFPEIKNNAKTIVTKLSSSIIEIDEIDKSILLKLSYNARANITEIAKDLNLTSTAVAKRIRKLKEKDIILAYKPQLNLNSLHVKVFLHLQKVPKKKRMEIITYFSIIPEVLSVSKTFGDYELEFRAAVENILDLHTIIEDFKNKYYEEFIDFNLMIFVKFHKVLNFFPFL